MQSIQLVTLPDGKSAIEVEYAHFGGSETQMSYAYFLKGHSMTKEERAAFSRDYWGRIEGVEVRSGLDLDALLCKYTETEPS
jgi:hypothetical protein